MRNQHLGSDFDDFLAEEGILDEAEAVATKRVLAYQIAKEMEDRKLSKASMARRMNTSRSALDRLLDPEVPSVRLVTMERAARVLGKKLEVRIM